MIGGFESGRSRVDEALRDAIEKMGDAGRLREACEYALMSGGKRLRPILVLLIAEEIGKRDVMPAALSVEYFHTASLIADDLPCMDDDDFRRNKQSLHKAFEESVALLASYTLIAEGYGGIYETGRRQKLLFPQADVDARVAMSLETVTRCAGLRGATHGQYLDLFPPDATWDTIRTIIERKTITLFEISFVLGWLFGGGDREKLDEVKSCAYHLGMAFQIADDLQDMGQDQAPGSINIAQACGVDGARARFSEESEKFACSLKALGLWTRPFRKICTDLAESAECRRLVSN